MMSTSTVFQKPISKTSQLTNDSGFINSDIVATNYSDLTFPVAEGDLCIYEGVLYAANQAISTSETWTSSHWTATSIDELNSNALSAINGNKKIELLKSDEIENTVQSITFDQQTGNVSQIVHSQNSVTLRTDVFTFGTNTITEVRTLSTGESLTIETNTTTLATTVTYSAA